MTERVEAIRRQHVSAGPYMVHEPTRDCDVCALLAALAQAEREREELTLELARVRTDLAFQASERKNACEQWDAARAEVERLKEQHEISRKVHLERMEQAEADLAKAERAALTKLLAELSDVQLEAVREGCGNTNAACLRQRVDEARAALEGRG